MKRFLKENWQRVRESSFVNSNLKMGPMSLVKFVTGPFKGKGAARLLGAEGVGFLGISSQIQQFGMSASTLSMATVLTQELGLAIANNDVERRRDLLRASLFLQLCGSAVVIVLGLLFTQYLSKNVYDDPRATVFTILPVLLSIPFASLISTYFSSILYAHGRYELYSHATTMNFLFEVVVFLGLAYYWGLSGAVWSILITSIFWAGQLAMYSWKLEPSLFHFTWRIKLDLAKRLGWTGISFLISGLFSGVVVISLRGMISQHLGVSINGYYQVLLVFSAYYTPFITNGIWADLFPKFSRSKLSIELWKEWANHLILAAWFGAAIEMCLLVAPELMIKIFFTKDFLKACPSLPWQFMSDFFALIMAPCSAFLMARGRFNTVLLVSMIVSVLTISVSRLCIQRFGLPAIPFAYFVANLIGVATVIFLMRKEGKDRFSFFTLIPKLLLPIILLFAQSAIFLFSPWLILRFILPVAFGSVAATLYFGKKHRGMLLYA